MKRLTILSLVFLLTFVTAYGGSATSTPAPTAPAPAVITAPTNTPAPSPTQLDVYAPAPGVTLPPAPTASSPTAAPVAALPQTSTYNVTLDGKLKMIDLKPGDPEGKGTATITINLASQEVCWELRAEGIRLPAGQAHIHNAPKDLGGPIVAHLTAPDGDGHSKGCASSKFLEEIVKNPAEYAVVIHTIEFRQGALRGQLAP